MSMNDFPPTVVVGDVHGNAAALLRLLAHVPGNFRLIFVGDYINRGPDSALALEILATEKIRRGRNLVLLRGNHEDALLRVLDSENAEDDFIRHGGLTTLASYISEALPHVFKQFRQVFPETHRRLLEATLPVFEDGPLFVSHAGWDPADVAGRSFEQMAMGARDQLFDLTIAQPAPLTVFGHYVQASGRPFIGGGRFCLDTGCGSIAEAPLTALWLPEQIFRQF